MFKNRMESQLSNFHRKKSAGVGGAVARSEIYPPQRYMFVILRNKFIIQSLTLSLSCSANDMCEGVCV